MTPANYAKVKEVFAAAIELPEEQRTDFVKRQGAGEDDTIREVLSSVVWEQLNKFYHMVRSAAQFNATLEQPQDFCERVRLASHLLVGATDTTMSHGEAWHFSRIGRLVRQPHR